ncbi:hypothetical protein [Enterococcus sp. AZ072]|uniref:hypothetical protein n=1 Tax=unclassified Enterococcus TaxID=2608891 RepID=UPI003D279BEA
MALLLSESAFTDYMDSLKSNASKTVGISLISLNLRSLNPTTNIIYLSDNFLFAARYNEKSGSYSDGFFLKQKEIVSFELTKGILSDILLVNTTIVLENGETMQLKMSFPKASASSWHRQSLNRLPVFIKENWERPYEEN